MKLLLTSTGVTNKSIHKALEDLIGKPTKESKIAFIPTGAYGATNDRAWLVKEMLVARDLGWENFNVVELTALTKDQIKQQLTETDVIHINGGNAYFLMDKIIKSGVEDLLVELFKTKVYIGSSAGSIVAGSYSPVELAKIYKEEGELNQNKIDHYLGYVREVLKTHLNSPKFPGRVLSWYETIAPKIKAPLYALDDNSALRIVDGKVEVISEGEWKRFN